MIRYGFKPGYHKDGKQMGRKHRNFVKGGIYHIIQRGHNRSYIFNEETEKVDLLNMIRETKTARPFQILYYVLMDNHYHMIIEMQDVSIDKAMHHLNLAFSRYYNKKYETTGTIYCERYRAFAVTETRYLMKLILYIAFNPIKVGIVKHPADYFWSAHTDISTNCNELVSIQRLFEMLGCTPEEGALTYGQLIRQELFPVSRAPNHNAFLIEQRCENLEMLLEEMLANRAPASLIRSGNRDAFSNQLRNEFINLAAKQGFKNSEIARFLNMTDRCIRQYRVQKRKDAKSGEHEPD